MKKMLKLSVAAVLLATTGLASAVALDNDQQKFSYAMGVNLANLLISQGIDEIDSAALAAAMDDVINGKPLQMDLAGLKQAIENQQMKMQAKAQQAADAKKQAGADFLAANAKKSGVTVLENGLQYEVLKSGDGKQPAATDTVSVHYHGTLTDGSVFDSSVERGEPASFPLDGVIAGFREAITRMHVGDKWRVYVPSELGYGESGAGRSIGPNETLIFEIDLLAVE
jgi:FKBP-type peptidyl-prolyl cis-trans isomerase FklB